MRSAISPYSSLKLLEVESTTPADPALGYRVRAKLMVGTGPRIGLYARRGDHEIVDTPNCVVLAPEIREAVQCMRALLAVPPVRAESALIPVGPGTGALLAIDVRMVVGSEDDKSLLLTLVLDRSRAPGRRALDFAAAAIRETVPRIAGVAANLRASHLPQVLGPATSVLSGESLLRDWTGSVYQLATYGAFVQAHRNQAQAIHAVIARAFSELFPLSGGRILDVYGGSGAIGIALAREGARVTLIESFAPAAQNALAAAREQFNRLSTGGGIDEARVGDAAEQLGILADAHVSIDGAVVDPPRRGVPPSARISLARLAPRRIVYVSCEPMTLARDLDHFARLGYRATRVRPFDMMPMTEQVETVTVLDRDSPARAQVMYQDPLLVIAAKGPHELRVDPTLDPAVTQVAPDSLLAPLPPQPLVPVLPVEAGMSGLVMVTPDRERMLERLRLPSCALKTTYVALLRDAVAVRGTLSLLPPLTRQTKQGLTERRRAPTIVRYDLVERVGRHSLVRFRGGMVVGSWLRRALRKAGHPILGDSRWGHEPTNRYMEERHGLDRPFWHCESVQGRTPSGEDFSVSCPLWPDLSHALESLRIEDPRPRG